MKRVAVISRNREPSFKKENTIYLHITEKHTIGDLIKVAKRMEVDEIIIDNEIDGNSMEIKGMNGATKFVDWLVQMGYLDKEEISTDGVDIAKDMGKIKEVAPKFYNMLMCMCDCEERA